MELSNREKIWLVLGAGISRDPPSSVPLWSEMKNATIRSVLGVLDAINRETWQNPQDAFEFDKTAADLQEAVSMPEIAMECLCDVFLEPNVKTQLRAAIAPVANAPRPNFSHDLIAQLIATGRVKGVVTTNFDRLLEETLEKKRISYQVVLPSNLRPEEIPLPIFKVHGSIDAPGSLVFLQSNYAKGLPKPIADYLLTGLRNSLIIVCGYSGNDLDLFPLLRRAIIDPLAGNTTLVVDPSDMTRDSPYSELGARLMLVRKTAMSFFAELQNKPVVPETLPPIPQIDASLLPFKEPFECALLVANVLLAARYHNRAMNYFYLAEDVATDAENYCGKGIATIGRSLCLFGIRQNQGAFFELERGCSILSSVDIEDVDSTLGAMAEGRRMSVWIMRARHALALTALAIALRSSDSRVKSAMARIASLHCHPLSVGELEWHSEQTEPHLVSRTVVMNKLTGAYEAFVSSDPEHLGLFEECLDICRNGGHLAELLATLHIMMTIHPNNRAEYRMILDESEQLIAKEVRDGIFGLFQEPGSPFGDPSIPGSVSA